MGKGHHIAPVGWFFHRDQIPRNKVKKQKFLTQKKKWEKSSQLSEHVNHRTVAHAHNNRERKKQLTANTFSVSALKCSSNTTRKRRRRSSTSHYKCVSSFFLLAISFVFNDEFRKRKKNELINWWFDCFECGWKRRRFSVRRRSWPWWFCLFACVCDTSSLKNTRGHRERERKWRWWWGLCCWCVSKNFSSRISHIACPRFSWRRADDAKKKWNRIELLTIVFFFSSFDYSSSYIFEGSSIAKIPNVFFFCHLNRHWNGPWAVSDCT